MHGDQLRSNIFYINSRHKVNADRQIQWPLQVPQTMRVVLQSMSPIILTGRLTLSIMVGSNLCQHLTRSTLSTGQVPGPTLKRTFRPFRDFITSTTRMLRLMRMESTDLRQPMLSITHHVMGGLTKLMELQNH